MSTPDENLTYEYHKELCPEIWDNGELKPEVHERLMEIAEVFLDWIGDIIEPEDITITGSLANYNYTKYSDIDLHIITDLKGYEIDPELLKDYFNAKKAIWNLTRDIKVKGHEVELYVQDASEPHHASGVYSLRDEEWLTKPVMVQDKQDIDLEVVKKKRQTMLDLINFALGPDCNSECAEKAKHKFLLMRKAGLEQGGDFAPENLAFKELRRSGDIERLVKGVIGKKDKELSLDSVDLMEADLPTFMSVNKKRGPRHQGLTAGVNRITRPEVKSIGVVADMHKIGTENPAVHHLKKKPGGTTGISTSKAIDLINQYDLDINKIQAGKQTQLSTSGISIGFNPQTNTYFLHK